MFDAIIISDIHLGSNACQVRRLDRFLTKINSQEIKTKELIINGDFFDSWDFRRLNKHHWKILGDIRKLSDHVPVIWNVGNHDGPAEIISHLLGISVKNEYSFLSGDKKILALHGHIFDSFISEHPVLTRMADVFYGFLQKVDPSLYTARAAKRASKTFLRNAELIKGRAIAYAKKKNEDIVCCGHSHHEDESVNYFNSGCWTEAICSYLAIQNGNVSLRHFEEESENSQLP